MYIYISTHVQIFVHITQLIRFLYQKNIKKKTPTNFNNTNVYIRHGITHTAARERESVGKKTPHVFLLLKRFYNNFDTRERERESESFIVQSTRDQYSLSIRFYTTL